MPAAKPKSTSRSFLLTLRVKNTAEAPRAGTDHAKKSPYKDPIQWSNTLKNETSVV